MMNEHIDVRGPWPLYVRGSFAKELPWAPRLITVEQAREYNPPDRRSLLTEIRPSGNILFKEIRT